ncbi:integrin alpha-M-like [Aplochiton taeniatus]
MMFRNIFCFSIAQYSNIPQIHYHFNAFRDVSWESNIDGIPQQGRATFTAAAIKHVVQEAFSVGRGSRPNVKKVLIVITDGQSHDADDLRSAASEGDKKNIVRFAIGVGSAFDSSKAQKELDTIASSPAHVFKVDSFQALDAIKNTLQENIFSIEVLLLVSIAGSDSSGAKLKMEMAQEGFSAAYVPGGFRIGTVGAREWRGGYQEFLLSNRKSTFHEHPNMEPDSYLGYSMAVASVFGATFTILGAPRYQHTGAVMVFAPGKNNQVIEFKKGGQSGMYFGAEVCAMDVDGDGNSDQVLISAPMYKQRDREGRVYACAIESRGVDCSTLSMLDGIPGDRGRFGFSVASLPDLNGDGFNDVAIGAPFENDGQGSIYIFHGEKGKINQIYSQRIPGSDVMAGLKFFGLSISQSSHDLSGDFLPDLAVGTKGAVFILRSRPIVTVQVRMVFNPTKIPTNDRERDQILANKAQVCFIMKPFLRSGKQTVQGRINYTLTLDYERKVNYRAYFIMKQREVTNTIDLEMQEKCKDHLFYIKVWQLLQYSVV